jgi:16S rRNA processing protein RimM
MIRVGKIVATHGLQGAIVMTHIVGDARWLKKGQPLMIEMLKDSLIPYFVIEIKSAGSSEIVVLLEDIQQMEMAKKLVGKAVYIAEDVLIGYDKKSPLLWLGFSITDVNTGIIGVIDDVMQTSNQWLGRVMYNDTEVLIPLIDQFIKQVDLRKKRLIMELPQGLLEVYTSQ